MDELDFKQQYEGTFPQIKAEDIVAQELYHKNFDQLYDTQRIKVIAEVKYRDIHGWRS